MKQVQAYRCEHCGKVYLMKSACIEHEAHRCPHNPENRPLCYDCKHYQPSAEADNKERIIYYSGFRPWDDEEIKYSKKFDPNKCECTDRKLFNNIKLSDEMQDALHEAGEKLLKHKLLLGEDKKQFNKSIDEMSKYTRDFAQTFLNGREVGRMFSEDWGTYKDKILKLLELEEDYK